MFWTSRTSSGPLRTSSSGGYVCSFESGGTTQDVSADHVVLSLPFTTLRSVDLSGVAVSQNHADTDAFYGAPEEFTHVLRGDVPVPMDARPFVRTVVKYFHAAQE